MNISQPNQEQMKKVVKALVYAFVSGSLGAFALLSANFIQIVQGGSQNVNEVFYSLVMGAVVGGINGVAVYLKKLTEPS